MSIISLNAPSSVCLTACASDGEPGGATGADPGALSAWEQRMGVQLPSELWELYRYRNGQAPGAFVTFADDMRLLGGCVGGELLAEASWWCEARAADTE